MSYNRKRILIEASGSLVSGYLIKAIKESGNICVASDIDDFNHSKCLADEFIIFPKSNKPDLWNEIEHILLNNKIDIVIPSFDETLLGWAKRKEYFSKKGIYVIISDVDTIDIFLDKYKTYLFCKNIDILTPNTSLSQDYLLVKPRNGRGGKDVYISEKSINMGNMISQEFIEGREFTVDCFFDKNGSPIYIIPRLRIDVKDGKSTKGIVIEHEQIEKYVIKISKNIKFFGPINFQFIEDKNKTLYFIECNPRIAGGMALGFAASENWIDLIIKNFINNKDIVPKNIKYNLKMVRYYDECFV